MNIEELLNSVILDSNDINKWWYSVISKINSDIKNFSDKEKLVLFLNDYIEFLEKEVVFCIKYSNLFHENVVISRNYEIDICKQLLSKLV